MRLFWNQYARSIVLDAILLLTGFLLGIWIKFPGTQAAPMEYLPAEQVSTSGERSILPQTSVLVRYTFLRCGHILEQPYEKNDLVGFTAAQVEKLWRDAKVMELDDKNAVIERELLTCCPAHVMLHMTDERALCYTKTDETDYDKQHSTPIEFDAVQLPEEVQRALQNGIVFGTLGEIDAYLEGMES